MDSRRSAYAARSPPPLQHPIPTHPTYKVSASPMRASFGDEQDPYAPQNAYAPPQPRAAAHAKAGGYQRMSSPRPHTPGTQPRGAYTPQQRAATYATRGSRSNSTASVVPNSNMYQSASAPYYEEGVSTPDVYPNTEYVPTPPADDGWGFGTQDGMGAGMINDATTQMGMQFGRHVAAVGGEYVQKNVRAHTNQLRAFVPMPMLKHYFNVSNSYVLHKLRILLFPWRHKPWSRRLRYSTPYGGSGIMSPGQSASPTPYSGMHAHAPPAPDAQHAASVEPVSYCVPRDDVNSPDMYIPFMAFVTYTIAASVIYGLRGRFHPENLGYTASRALAIVFVEFSAVKLGCYLLNIQGDHTIFDLVAYSGYKFVGTLLVLGVGMLQLGRGVYWATFFYVFAANAFFLLRSLRYVVLPDPSSPSSVTVTQAQRATRIQFLFAIAMSQVVFGWLLIAGIY